MRGRCAASPGSARRPARLRRGRARAPARSQSSGISKRPGEGSSCASLCSTRGSGQPFSRRGPTSGSGAARRMPPAARIVSRPLAIQPRARPARFAPRARAAGSPSARRRWRLEREESIGSNAPPALRSPSASASNRSRSGVHPRELYWACDPGASPGLGQSRGLSQPRRMVRQPWHMARRAAWRHCANFRL